MAFAFDRFVMSEAPSPPARRRSDRVVPITHVGVAIHGGSLPFTLWNLSFGGFAIVSARPFTPGTEARFTFTERRSGLWLNVAAKAAHSMVLASDGGLQYLSGWEFLLTGEEETAIKILFAAATGRTPSASPAAPVVGPRLVETSSRPN
jgi:hypothetical protein